MCLPNFLMAYWKFCHKITGQPLVTLIFKHNLHTRTDLILLKIQCIDTAHYLLTKSRQFYNPNDDNLFLQQPGRSGKFQIRLRHCFASARS